MRKKRKNTSYQHVFLRILRILRFLRRREGQNTYAQVRLGQCAGNLVWTYILYWKFLFFPTQKVYFTPRKEIKSQDSYDIYIEF